jgi:hypothetical protein
MTHGLGLPTELLTTGRTILNITLSFLLMLSSHRLALSHISESVDGLYLKRI